MKQQGGLNDPKSGTFSDMTYVTWFQFTMNQAPVEAQVPSGAMEIPPFVDDCSIKISILRDDQSHQRVFFFKQSESNVNWLGRWCVTRFFPKRSNIAKHTLTLEDLTNIESELAPTKRWIKNNFHHIVFHYSNYLGRIDQYLRLFLDHPWLAEYEDWASSISMRRISEWRISPRSFLETTNHRGSSKCPFFHHQSSFWIRWSLLNLVLGKI